MGLSAEHVIGNNWMFDSLEIDPCLWNLVLLNLKYRFEAIVRINDLFFFIFDDLLSKIDNSNLSKAIHLKIPNKKTKNCNRIHLKSWSIQLTKKNLPTHLFTNLILNLKKPITLCNSHLNNAIVTTQYIILNTKL